MCNGPERYNYHKIGYAPFMREEMLTMIRHFMGHVNECMKQFEGGIPHHLEKYEEYYMISVPLPGFSKDDINVSIIENEINIEAKRQSEENKDKKVINHRRNRRYPFNGFFPNFLRNDVNTSFPLPPNSDVESIKSKMKNGLLKIKIGKNPPRNINIDTEENN